MTEAWEVMGFTYLLAAAVSLVVAVLIHLLVLVIRKFSRKETPVPQSNESDIEIAIALAVAIRGNRK